ncbi:MAG TPA: M28 family peptidase [Thermoanaerobaculia bacterium]|nr:M28 family peptidase [Thermoanaerobaculia bacterium]
MAMMATEAEPVKEERGAGSWGLVLALVLFALTLLLVRARLEPPAPKGADAPAAEFSGTRARELLRSLAGDGSPHPAGSPANERIRETILAELRRLGYTPQVQEGIACSRGATCANLRNVVARLEGSAAGKAVLLMAHYDSVAAGVGAGDDLSGVATVLETARALKAGPPLQGPVILLLDDGEEMGLLGAELFVSRHPMAKEIGVVVNLEARGTSGPSLMFETIGDDAWPVGLYSGAAPHPITSSVYATIYEVLPNDTDLSVFKRSDRGYQGLNFAFIRNPMHYHTSADSVENVSPSSLQHHGDNALAAVRALAGTYAASPPKGDVVFFDVLGFGVVRWPKGLTPVLAVLALVLVGVAAVLALRRGTIPRRGLLFGLLGFFGAVVLAALLSMGLGMGVRGASPYAWSDDPLPEIAAFWLLALGVVMFISAAVSRRAGAPGLWAGVWIGWAVLGVAVALTAPGISYLFVVPAVVAGITGLVARPGGTVSSLVPGLVAAVLWIPLLLPLYDGLGLQALVVIGVLAAALFTTLAPLVPASGSLGRKLLPIAAVVLALVCVVLAYASAPFSEDAPQPLAIRLFQDADSRAARWLVRGAHTLPPALRQVARFSDQRETPYPWAPNRAYVAPAQPVDLPGPQVSVLEDSAARGKRRLRLLLTSNRQARMATVAIPPGAKLESARMEGQEVPLGLFRQGEDWAEIEMVTLPPDGVELEIVLGERRPQDWYVYDVTPGLPPAGEALRDARPASAVTFQEGDTILLSRKVRI